MPLLKIFKAMVAKKPEGTSPVNEKMIQELKELSDGDLDVLSNSAPGMTNIYIQAEKKRREEEKKAKNE